MSKKLTIKKGTVQETLLIPLYGHDGFGRGVRIDLFAKSLDKISKLWYIIVS